MPDRHRHENLLRGDLRHPRLRARIRDGEPLIGTFVKSRDPAVAEVLALARYDFVVADLEHSTLTVRDVEGIVRACDCYDVPVIVRLPATGLGRCGQLLDAGVTGIQVSDGPRDVAWHLLRGRRPGPALGGPGPDAARDLHGPVDAGHRRAGDRRPVADASLARR